MPRALFVAVAAALQALTGPAVIPVDLEPNHHIVYTDEALRVLQVNLPGGYDTLEHVHSNDLVTVNIENGPTRTREQGQDWGTVRERQVGSVNVTEYTGHASSHVVRVMTAKPYRLTGVENRRSGGWTTLPPIVADGLTVAAESRAFRGYAETLQAGASVTHTHPVPVVVVLVEGAATAGATTLAGPGSFAVVPAGQAHTVRASSAARVVEVEVR